jgi:hypothetical protein
LYNGPDKQFDKHILMQVRRNLPYSLSLFITTRIWQMLCEQIWPGGDDNAECTRYHDSNFSYLRKWAVALDVTELLNRALEDAGL